jgi:predicted transglutaminase-like cysteine proteinase
MSIIHRSSRSAVLLALALTVTATATASARPTGKKAPQQPASFSVDISATAPARYFTINQVLAKSGMQRAPGALQFASTGGTMTDAPATGAQMLPSSEPFGLSAFRAPEGLLWVKWRGVEQHMKAEAREIERCRADSLSCSPASRRFIALVDSVQAQDGRARIEAVNRTINSAIRYTSDQAQHGVADLWTAPLATLTSGRGDCEDYAIAKYAVLRAAGVPANDLRLLLVRDRAARQDHAVLAVRDNGRWLVLDNRHLMLSETTALPQFTPLFALDHQGVSLFAAPYAAQPARSFEPAGSVPPTASSDASALPAIVSASAELF